MPETFLTICHISMFPPGTTSHLETRRGSLFYESKDVQTFQKDLLQLLVMKKSTSTMVSNTSVFNGRWTPHQNSETCLLQLSNCRVWEGGESQCSISSNTQTLITATELHCCTCLCLCTRVPWGLCYTDFNKGHVTIKVLLEEAVRVRESKKIWSKAPSPKATTWPPKHAPKCFRKYSHFCM